MATRHNNAGADKPAGPTQLIEAVFDSTPVLLAHLDPQFNFVRVNAAYAAADGQSPEFFVGKNHFDLYPNDDNRRIFGNVRDTGVAHSVSAQPFEYARSPERGQTHWDWSLTPFLAAAGRCSGLVLALVDVTERVRAIESLQQREAALAEHEERMKLALAAAGQTLWEIDPLAQESRVSPEYAQMLGYDPQSFLESRESWSARIHPDDRARIITLMTQYVNGEIPVLETEYRMRTRSGEWKWFWSVGRALERDASGRVTRMIGTLADITSRKMNEIDLRDSEARLQGILNSMFVFVGLFSADGILIEANQAPLDAANLRREDVIGQYFPNTYWWSYSPAVQAQLAQALRQAAAGETVRYDVPVRVADGAFITLDVMFGPLRNAQGSVVEVIGCGVDITDRKRAEQLTAASEARFRGLWEASTDALLLVDATGTIRMANAEALLAFGYADDELVGQNIQRLVPHRFPGHEQLMRDYFEFPHKRRVGEMAKVWGRAKNGREFPAEVSLSPIETEEGVAVMAAIRDITGRTTLEQRVLQSQKMDAVGRLAGGLAHDLNNILTAVSGFTEITLETLGAAHPVAADLQEVLGGTARATELIKKLLAFSRQDASMPRPIELNEVIRGFQKMIRRLLPENIEMSIAAGSPLAPIEADPAQIEQVLLNLAVNAADAMPQGGRLRIETSATELDAGSHPGLPAGRYARLVVSDTGCGMSEEVRRQALEPFFTTKEPGKGTGLGLTTVYSIVQQSKGHLELLSAPGQGTSVRITFPATQHPVISTASAPSPAGVSRGTESILLVEDEDGVRGLAWRLLDDAGYVVTSTASPVEALHMIRNAPERFDLLLTDVIMPQMGGDELAESALALRPDLKVLFMSGYLGDVRAAILNAPVPRHFIQKPFSREQLLTKVRQVLGHAAPANRVG